VFLCWLGRSGAFFFRADGCSLADTGPSIGPFVHTLSPPTFAAAAFNGLSDVTGQRRHTVVSERNGTRAFQTLVKRNLLAGKGVRGKGQPLDRSPCHGASVSKDLPYSRGTTSSA